jgi:23S rRNA pseudouridine2457 synthase
MHRYFVVYKPYKMLSQFVSPYEHTLLGDLNYNFPQGTQAVGRLDEDSEGLLLLTNDKSLTGRLLHPEKKHCRKYIVQVKRKVEPETLLKLSDGIDILVQGKGLYKTQPCEVKLIDKPKHLPERADTMKEFVPHSWLEFTLEEGKKRQIRKMCKAVRHDCRRLIRISIEGLELGNMQPGEVREIEQAELFILLKLNADCS